MSRDVQKREVAHRVFATEFADSTLSFSEGDDEEARNYVVTPTGACVHRLFVAGILTEVECVNDETRRGRVVDRSGAFVTYAGQYQPEAQTFLERTEPPAFVALTGVAHSFKPEDSDRMFTSVRPESLNSVDAVTHDRWVISAAEATLDRLAIFEEALNSGLRGDDLRAALEAGDAPVPLAAGIPKALDHYGTTMAYAEAIRRLAVDALELIAGERDELRMPEFAPDAGGDTDIGPLPATGVRVEPLGSAGATAIDDKEGVTNQGGSGLSDDEIQARLDQLPERMERLELKDDTVVTQSDSNSPSTTSREPDLDNVSSPPRRSLTYEDIELGDPIGSGGQGVVYHAEIPGTAGLDQIALKEPQGQNQTINDSIIEAFLEEAQSWQVLATRERQKPRWQGSEYIVGIIATGEKMPWIAMEYMDGGSLDERLADSPNGLPLAEALWVGECVCRGVELAHNYGIAHLDLKPENILFRETSEGKWDVPKLADWGVSRKLAEQTGAMEALSVKYAAPEQFEPEEFGDPDTLTDIYQVGVLLYTIFTGDAPYTGGQLATMRSILDGDEPTAPSELREDLLDEIDSIVLKAMSREKGMRYRAIGVLANELHTLREKVSESNSIHSDGD